MNRFVGILLISVLGSVWFATASEARIVTAGSGHFTYVDQSPTVARRLTVWYYCPTDLDTDADVVFVMHGTKRNGADYRDNWIELASANNFLVLVPEFSKQQYPGTAQYQYGNVKRDDGTLRPASEWSFTAIERIFDYVIAENSLRARDYVIFGHSAGAQFVHRMILMYPDARTRLAISANAGTYTMPTGKVRYPFGLNGSPSNAKILNKSLQKRLIVLLGQQDIDPQHRYLSRKPEAMAQGRHRVERGFAFFEAAQQCAAQRGIDLNWQLVTVPKVGHENAKMAIAAADLIRLSK